MQLINYSHITCSIVKVQNHCWSCQQQPLIWEKFMFRHSLLIYSLGMAFHSKWIIIPADAYITSACGASSGNRLPDLGTAGAAFRGSHHCSALHSLLSKCDLLHWLVALWLFYWTFNNPCKWLIGVLFRELKMFQNCLSISNNSPNSAFRKPKAKCSIMGH